MTTRTALLAAVTAVALAAAPAHAKTYCKLLKEKPGDVDNPTHAALRAPTPFAPYDLKWMDLASNATHLTAVVHVGDLAYTSPTRDVEGAGYAVAFSLDERHHYSLVATVGGGHDSFDLWSEPDAWLTPEDEGQQRTGVYTSGPRLRLTRVKGVVDVGHDEVRMTVPLSAFGRGVAVPGKRITHMGGNSFSYKLWLDSPAPDKVATGWQFGSFEDALNAHAWEAYPLGAKSCVTVGR